MKKKIVNYVPIKAKNVMTKINSCVDKPKQKIAGNL
jgi:hypothetical protein